MGPALIGLVVLAGVGVGSGRPTADRADEMQRETLVAALHPSPKHVSRAAVAVAAVHSQSLSLAMPVLAYPGAYGGSGSDGGVLLGDSPTWTGAHTFSGDVTMNGGTGALGFGAGETIVPADGALNVTGGITLTGSFSFNDANVGLAETGTDDLDVTADAAVVARFDGNGFQVASTRWIGFNLLNGNTRMAYSGTDDIDFVADNETVFVLSGAGITLGAGNSFVGSLGTGTAAPTAGGTLSVITTAVGNVDGGPDTLQSYTLPASSLITTGRGIKVYASGTFANTGNAKTLTCYVGTQAVLTHAATVSVANETWEVNVKFTRTGSSTQDWEASYKGPTGVAGAFEYELERGTATQTETGSMAVYCEATTATATNDIIQEFQLTEAY